jgi:hypothetical protein
MEQDKESSFGFCMQKIYAKFTTTANTNRLKLLSELKTKQKPITQNHFNCYTNF